MDLENGGGVANNQKVQPEQGDEEELVPPDPAADYLSCRSITANCLLVVTLWFFGAFWFAVAYTTIPWTIERGWRIVFPSADGEQWTAFVLVSAIGLEAFGSGCFFAAVLALRCCLGSHSSCESADIRLEGMHGVE